MTRSSRRRPIGLFVVPVLLILVGGSCRSDTGPGEDTSAATIASQTWSGRPPAGPDADAAAHATGDALAALEDEWSAARTAVVAWLGTGIYGVDGSGTLNGPGGLSVDLRRCPVGWDDRAGVTESTITIAMVVARSGSFASFGRLADGFQAYIDQVNEAGGIDGRTIELDILDDAYIPENAAAAVASHLADATPLYVTTVGTPGTFAAQQQLDAACVPQPLVASPHPAWGDPGGHPFTSAFDRSQSSEALLWGAWMRQNLADVVPVTVGFVAIDNDYGDTYLDAFRAWAAANPDIVAEVVAVPHDPGDTELDDEVAVVATAAPHVVIAATAGTGCDAVIRGLAAHGLDDITRARFLTAGCLGADAFTAADRRGTDGDGVLTVGPGMRSTTDPRHRDDAFISWVNDSLTGAGLDPTDELTGVGFAQYGWAHVELLRLASRLPGGLSRTNIVQAMWATDLDHPMLVDGIRYATAGDDPYLIEGGEYLRYDSARSAWLTEGWPADVNGLTPACTWVLAACGTRATATG